MRRRRSGLPALPMLRYTAPGSPGCRPAAAGLPIVNRNPCQVLLANPYRVLLRRRM